MSTPATPTTRTSPLNALGRFVFWFSLIIAAIAVYYFFLIERGSEHVYHRNFRALTQIERQINSGFDRLAKVLSTQAATNTENNHSESTKLQKVGGHKYQLQLKVDGPSKECGALANPNAASDTLFKVHALGGNAVIDFCVRGTKGHGYALTEYAPLSDFINASTALEQFHQVLVFDGARNLIYRSSEDSGNLARDNVYDLLAENITTHEALVALPDGWLHDEDDKKSNKQNKSEEHADDNKSNNSSANLIPFSKVHEFTIGEEKYLAFVRPIKLDYASIDQPGDAPTWYVVGITTASDFNASRFVIPRWWMAIFVLALALFILSTPYLKLRLLGPRDLIRSSTITMTVVATLFAAMITTVMLLNLSGYALAANDIDHQLHASSELLAKGFAQELDAKKKALEQIIADGPKNQNQTEDGNQFIRATLFDKESNLAAIWNPHATTKPSSFSVSDRNFWQELERYADLPIDNSDLTYALDNVLNRLDGKKLTILAKRVDQPVNELIKKDGWTTISTCNDKTSANCDKKFSIATGQFLFNIFSHALLPKGFGFIVIDNSSGIAQYHSEAGADLIEHLYEETDNNAALKTAINAGSPDTFITNYRGHRYLFHTRPLTYSRWTLVTYFNQELLDRVNLGLLLSATGLSVAFLMLYLGAGLLGFKALSNTKINLLWPNPSQTRAYWALSILLSVLTLAVITAIARLHADQLFSVIALAPLAALSGTYVCLVKRYQPFQTLIATRRLAADTRRKLARDIFKDGIALIVATFLILLALLWANAYWPWQLLPHITPWIANFLRHGSGLFYALLLIVAAHFTLRFGLRTRNTNDRNAAGDHRRAFLLVLLLTSNLILIANLLPMAHLIRTENIALIAAVGIVIALSATLTQPLWMRDCGTANKNRCKFYLPIDRRSDRGPAYTLHRICVTLIISVLVVLPAVAFYRDAASLYLLRWLQQDAQKYRAQIEHLLEKPNNNGKCSPDDISDNFEQSSADLTCRFNAIVAENENYDLLARSDSDPANGKHSIFSIAPNLTLQSQIDVLAQKNPAEARLMRPVTQLSHNLASIAGFSKIEKDTDDDMQFSTWRVIDERGQHLLGTLKLSYADQWLNIYWREFFDFGFLSQYRLWILLALALFGALLIYPMLRLILRELVAEADLRPYPVLTPTELELLLNNYRNTLLLVSGNSLNKAALDIAELECDTVAALNAQLVQTSTSARKPLIAALPEKLTEHDIVPDIMVISEQRWQTLAQDPSLQNAVCSKPTHSADKPEDDFNPSTWQAVLEGSNKLRYPDDVPDLALDHWQLDRTCTLLICRNIEAQATLAAYAGLHGWHAQTLGKKISGEKIWLHNIEEIIFEPALRKQLLDILENRRTHDESRSIVLTSQILPHLWFVEKNSWRGEEISARELTRWMTVLTRINVRTVNALTAEHNMCEINRSYQALPRPSREAEYALWWQYSTQDERTALAALTHEGLINPYNRNVIRSLMARGLIFRGSTLRFSDKGFKLFVKYKYPVTQLRRQADIELQQSSWGAARGPLLITLAIFGYGVMVMGGGALESVLGLATSIGASIPALLNFARLMKRDAPPG